MFALFAGKIRYKKRTQKFLLNINKDDNMQKQRSLKIHGRSKRQNEL